MRTAASSRRARWWHVRPDGRIQCDACPRHCKLRDRQRGFCFVRRRAADHLELTCYGRNTAFSIDPVEKKPLHHFHPGIGVLSFGTIGCNLACRFCQNWLISRAESFDPLVETAEPAQIARAAKRLGCGAVAFTYNEPAVFAEYAIDVALECREVGVHPIAVTAGYMEGAARAEFFAAMDAVNIDLKSFSDDVYRRLCGGRLQPVLDTIDYVRHETAVWLEVTTLLIPGHNDGSDEIDRMADWFASHLGPDVPWHFSAYHPDFALAAPPTPAATLRRARDIALRKGLHYVYAGNVADELGNSTWCPACGYLLIGRQGCRVTAFNLAAGRCRCCGAPIPGRFSSQPGGCDGECRRIRIS